MPVVIPDEREEDAGDDCLQCKAPEVFKASFYHPAIPAENRTHKITMEKGEIEYNNSYITMPIDIPVSIAFFARSSLFAPTFCATKELIDCIRDDGISITKLTILFATPYPEDASSPILLMKATRARNEICVSSS